ncbi:MAG: Uma2 family endonuclease [Gemmataceae bacterium]|nr:Uma2 family endonuclease [Gemmataceae bacterium]
MATQLDSAPAGVEYPSSDGKPMAESDLHRHQMARAIETIQGWFADRTDVYVTGNLLVYFEEGNPRRCRAPDLMVVLGAPKGDRDVYKVWEEGRFPDFVLEITSRSTKGEDTDEKFRVYRDEWRVREYFLFDPLEEYLDPSLRGYRLVGGEYQPIVPHRGQVASEVLGLRLDREGMRLVFRNPDTASTLLPPAEERARRAELARELAETKARFAEDERSMAEMQRDAERRAREAAEAEVARLRAELAALRNPPPPAN